MCTPSMPSSQMNKSVMRRNNNGGSLYGLVSSYAKAKREGRKDEARQFRSQAKSMSRMSIKKRRQPENLGSSGTGVNFNN